MSSKRSKSRFSSKPSHEKPEALTRNWNSSSSGNTAYYSVSRNASMKRLNLLVEESRKNQESLAKSEEKIRLFYDQLSSISQATSSIIGHEFFNQLVQSLSSVFGVRYAFIGKIVDISANTIRTMALWNGKDMAENFTYCLKGTPCEQIIARKSCFFPKGIQKIFTKDKFLVDWNIHSYLGVPLINSEQQPIGLLSLMDDKPLVHYDHYHSILNIFAARCVSEIERMNAEFQLKTKTLELVKSNQALKDFVSIASHDLQEPLRKIITFGSRLAEKEGELNPESKDYLHRMQKTSLRMQELIDDLLLFSKASTHAEPFKKTDLKVVISEVIADLELLLQKNDGNILVGSLPTLDSSPSQIRQLFQNLMSNAIKFHAEDKPPKIEIHSHLNDQGDWEISVQDQGIGFDEKYRERIFRPFERLHGRSEYEGTGMGLAICRKIVEGHGGTILVESQVGKGTCFKVIFPQNHSQ